MAKIPAHFIGIDHVVFRVTDIQRTLDFYKDVLGLSVERIFDKIGLHQVRCGRNLIDLIPLPAGQALPDPAHRGIEHLCLYVQGDIDEIIASLKASGIPISMGPMEVYGATGFGTSVYIKDPDGYELELKVDYAKNPVRFPPAPN